MKSLKLLTWLLIVGIFAEALPVEPFVESSTEPLLFDAAQYKDYIIKLKCADIRNYHRGIKVREVGGDVYEPSPSPPLPPLLQAPPPPQPVSPNSPNSPSPASPTPTVQRTPQTQVTRGNSPGSDTYLYSEYDEDVVKRSKREEFDSGLSTTNEPMQIDADKVILPGDVHAGTKNSTEECTAPLTQEWTNYNWYQVLLDNGGPPGVYLQKGLKLNVSKVWDPCARPVYPVQPRKTRTVFEYTHAEFEKVHRTEQVEIVFAGTPHEFADVKGQLIWASPNSTRRYFHLNYRKDDSGLYFEINYHNKCVFVQEFDVRVVCQTTNSICNCLNGKESCEDIAIPPGASAGLPPGLEAALIGG